MKPSSVIVMVGMRCTGKSFLVRDLLRYNRDISGGTIIAGLETYYGPLTPTTTVLDTYTPEVVNNLVQRQRRRSSSTDTDRRTFLVLDDCLYDNSWMKHTAIRNLFMHSRTLNTMFIITQQYVMGFPPMLRASIDYVFILRGRLPFLQRLLYEQFAATITDYDTFVQILEECTDKDFECLVIDNTGLSTSLEDIFFWYKADKPRLAAP